MSNDYNPLHDAAGLGDLNALAKGLNDGFDPNARDGDCPLHAAARHDQAAAAQMLLDRGAFVDEPGRHQRVPLHDAAQVGAQDTTRILLRAGAAVDARDKMGRTPLMLAAQEDHYPVARDLLAAGANPTLQDQSGRTATDWATGRDNQTGDFLRSKIVTQAWASAGPHSAPVAMPSPAAPIPPAVARERDDGGMDR